MEETTYRICRHLDDPARIIIFTVDEFVGLMLFSFIGFINHFLLTGIGIGTAWVMLFKYLKKGRGPWFFFQTLYWVLPGSVTRLWFRAFPDSAYRHWLS